ncbi:MULTISPECIES: hypothetical protein [Ralstonia solanacearum species complex]|uniref:hypothetical protein n=1 Tax=Ralstonia solanacearum species complex TaxID=3116862 RepID=UPI000E5743DC|nr:hypothetical protein [Ralstonia solanacearum]BEU73872.1 hypothetical protein MAFF211271_34270 [Ralstonia pseudosolanacearum]AXV78798.1 hypothetical protein CJO76_17465 [Ralstonia solanacearum]AXV92819.1 hypothetical protein CJO79_17450 [Ralstonia solanacearum]AXW20889.1 hypothetical protein CJO85_17495 [Ralstonia solanacearum]AXW77715.1 hypothetical protein CJO97_17445 [Ralstonia solanacearum]
MFTGLSKLVDKSFVLGFFLPALVGTLAFLLLNHDIGPLKTLLGDVAQEKVFSNLTVMLLSVWTFAVLLMAGNHSMYRVLEGYVWPLKQPRLRERQLERRKQQRQGARDAFAAIAAAETLRDAMTDEAKRAEQERRLAGLRLRYLGLRRKLALEYPEQRELVLPTRFGNVLRAFEMYAGNVYGVESIHAWPRLLAVVPKDYQETLADARAPVDFFVSLVFVSFVLGGVALARCAAEFPSGFHGIQPWWFAGVCTMAFVVSRLCYLAAVSTAIAWGETVKSAFDLYLPSLATALGYALPATTTERRRFWEDLANQFQFHEPLDPSRWLPVATAQASGEAPTPKVSSPEDNGSEGEDTPGDGSEDTGAGGEAARETGATDPKSAPSLAECPASST